MVYADITWIFVCAIPLALFVGWGVGANDVANAFGPSVGAKALTLKQALLVASIFEFAGAVLMGAGVVSTIRSGITNISYFVDKPDVLAYGMLCAMMATGTWLVIATYWELPVSSTHSIVSAVAGMTVVASGFNAVIWTAEKSTFPFVKGMLGICLSWVFSPILAGGFAFILFFFVRWLVLRSPNAYQRSLWLLPIFTFGTFWIVTYFVIAKAGMQFGWQKTPDGKKAWISACVASGTCLIAIFVGVPYIKKRVEADMAEMEQQSAGAVEEGGKDKGPSTSGSEDGDQSAAANNTRLHSRVWSALTSGINQDIHKTIEVDPKAQEIHDSAEVFDSKAETSFKYLQVFTACANSFSHGSNEVANSVGALAAIYQVWRDTQVSASAKVPTWLLAIGGVGIVLGVATYGYKIMKVLGVRVAKMTNSRGFCVEICAAAVVILASRFDLPVSTTHMTVGAVAGVGLLEGRRNFHWRLLLKIFAGWVATIIVVALTSAALMAQGLYAPNKGCTNERVQVGWYFNGTANDLAAYLNAAGIASGNDTLVQQAQSLFALTSGQQTPLTSLIPPMDTQAQALAYLGNSTLLA